MDAIEAAEAALIALRGQPPDMAGAVTTALGDATGGMAPDSTVHRAALAVAQAVERHGASFPRGAEPAYHDRLHQAETARAMGWLAGAARRMGLLTREEAALAVLAMAAHDLGHDGQVHAERGVLERRSAEDAGAIATAAGLPPADIAALRRIVLATTWPWEDQEAPDLSCRLAREADLFASSLPRLGPLLSRLLARELAAAGQPAPEGVATHAARVALLRLLPPASPPARALGLDAARSAQLAAYAGAARRLGLPGTSAEEGAAALDALDPADAEALLAWSGEVR
ncbi:hypothetical protein ROS9278_00818 [Roseomonas sp. CECT 9278]|nr:hypothetical protein ROS9278_00818 [Roseomonas sp. CECT 9278]